MTFGTAEVVSSKTVTQYQGGRIIRVNIRLWDRMRTQYYKLQYFIDAADENVDRQSTQAERYKRSRESRANSWARNYVKMISFPWNFDDPDAAIRACRETEVLTRR